MRLEEILHTQGFTSEKNKAIVHLMYNAYEVKLAVSRILKDYALTPEQYNVLRILKGSHPAALCNRDIAERTIERNSNTPRIVDRLEVKKLVKRLANPTDKRETLVSLTNAGINILQAANDALAANENSLMPLSNTDAAKLNELLSKMLTA